VANTPPEHARPRIATEKHDQLAALVRADPHAPRYHFLSPESRNICFDPNGALYWKGRYHLFYICQDPARRTGTEFWQQGHCWGHASSIDLVHWVYHPTALAPEPGDPEVAIYSGGAVLNKDGVPTLVYHGYGAGTCVATAADDDLITWRKSAHNPVIPEPKTGDPGWGIYNVFDPHVWIGGDTYYAILGGKVKPDDVRDTAYLFRSADLARWEYVHPFYAPRAEWTEPGDDCACPDFFPLGDRHALLCISHAKGARCYLGRYENETFFPEDHQLLNWPGGCCFAPETLVDRQGRRLMWAWALNQRRGGGDTLGVMTLPRVLALGEDGNLRVSPPVEFAGLRRNRRHWENLRVTRDTTVPLAGLTGDCLELDVVADVEPEASVGLRVRASPGGEEQTLIRYDAGRGELVVDLTRSSLANDGWRPVPLDCWRGIPHQNLTVQRAPFRVPAGEPLRWRIFLDRSMLEVFANDRLCLTQRVYPTRTDSTGVGLFAAAGGGVVRSLVAWDMTPTNTGEHPLEA